MKYDVNIVAGNGEQYAFLFGTEKNSVIQDKNVTSVLILLHTSSYFIFLHFTTDQKIPRPDLGGKDVVNYVFLYPKLANNLLPPIQLLTFLQLILSIEDEGRPQRMLKLIVDKV